MTDSSYTGNAAGARRRHPVQITAAVVGVVFLIVGIAGFIPGITTNYDQLTWAGHDSDALLLGLFQVSVLHNVVHLLFGIAGIAAGASFNAARSYLIVGGFIYLALFLYGLFVDENGSGNFVPVNNADNWLHLVLGIGMIALGAVLGRRPATVRSAGAVR